MRKNIVNAWGARCAGGYMLAAATTTKYAFDLRPGDIYWCAYSATCMKIMVERPGALSVCYLLAWMCLLAVPLL